MNNKCKYEFKKKHFDKSAEIDLEPPQQQKNNNMYLYLIGGLFIFYIISKNKNSSYNI
jgi:hypothetical protein